MAHKVGDIVRVVAPDSIFCGLVGEVERVSADVLVVGMKNGCATVLSPQCFEAAPGAAVDPDDAEDDDV